MTKLRSVLVLLAAFVVSVSFALPAEDVPETAYDESESLLWKSTPVFPIAVLETLAEAPVRARAVAFRKHGPQRIDLRTGSSHPVSDSLIILHHSLRC